VFVDGIQQPSNKSSVERDRERTRKCEKRKL